MMTNKKFSGFKIRNYHFLNFQTRIQMLHLTILVYYRDRLSEKVSLFEMYDASLKIGFAICIFKDSSLLEKKKRDNNLNYFVLFY